MQNIDYFDMIQKRESCREFSDKTVEQESLDALREYFSEADRLIPEIELSMEIYDGSIAERLGQAAGYNGFLIKAPQYLVFYSDEAAHYLENAAYVAQGVTLKLTQLGLAACWLTINKPETIVSELNPGSYDKAAVVVAFGYRDAGKEDARLDIKSPSNVKLIKSGTRKAPKLGYDTFASYGSLGQAVPDYLLFDDFKDALVAMATAQSFFNRQPYRALVDDTGINLIAYTDELTESSDEHLNYGIVMFNYAAVLGQNRHQTPAWTFDEPDNLKLPDGYFFVARANS